jgi:hypothetical protein
VATVTCDEGKGKESGECCHDTRAEQDTHVCASFHARVRHSWIGGNRESFMVARKCTMVTTEKRRRRDEWDGWG